MPPSKIIKSKNESFQDYKMEIRPFPKKHVHVAGIIPIVEEYNDFNFPFHGAFLPVNKGYTLLETKAYEMWRMNVESIWVISKPDTIALARELLGDWVGHENTKPVYYIYPEIEANSYSDTFEWYVLYGAYQAKKVSEIASRWIGPHVFYATYVQGAYDFDMFKYQRLNRRSLIHTGNRVLLSFNGKTAKDGEHLGFSFLAEDWNNMKNSYLDDQSFLTNYKEDYTIDIPWYYSLSSWEKYLEYLRSNHEI